MDAQYAAAYPALYRGHWWWRVREEIVLRRIRRILPPAGRARILDVGCGAALFFDALQQFGHVEGIESDPAALEMSGRWRSHIALGELDESYEAAVPFDLILLLDVLEHVADPERLLRRAGDILAPDGCILITVPAFNWLWTNHDDINRHLRRYTPAELRRTFDHAGLVIAESSYMFQSLVAAKLLVRLRETVSSAPTEVPRVPPEAINTALQTWFRLEYSLAGWLPFGASLLALAGRVARPAQNRRRGE